MTTVLDLIEPIALRVGPGGEVNPASPAARRWLEGRDASLTALFGAEGPAALRAQAERGEPAAPAVPWPEGPVSWDLFSEPGGGVLATGAAFRSADELAERLSKANLLDKSQALGVLPRERAQPLSERLHPKAFREATVLFIDAVAFSKLAGRVDPVTCLKQLDFFFSSFDQLTTAFGVEKIRTAGDSYMAVAGVPTRRASHAVDATLAALRCVQVVASGLTPMVDDWDWSFRFGLHSGPCISGVLGAKKPVFDLWGDTVSIAAHVERVGKPDHLCVSGAVQRLIEPFFDCVFETTTTLRSAGEVPIFLVRGLRAEFAADGTGSLANAAFVARYEAMFGGPCPEAATTALAVEQSRGLDTFDDPGDF